MGSLVVPGAILHGVVSNDLAPGSNECGWRGRDCTGNPGDALLFRARELDFRLFTWDQRRLRLRGANELFSEQCYQFDTAHRVANDSLGNERYAGNKKQRFQKEKT